MHRKKDPLKERILSYLKIKGIGKVISMSCDIPIRRRLARTDTLENRRNLDEYEDSIQDKIADNNLYTLMGELGVKKYCDINEPLYKAIELGELLKCLEEYGECKYAKNCWVTRKGFCEKKRQERLNGKAG